MSWITISSDYLCVNQLVTTTNTGLQIGIGILFTFLTILSIAVAAQEHSNRETQSVGASIVTEQVEGEAKATNEIAALFPVTTATIIF